MSTRSVVAIPTATGWKGRYIHSSGFPSYVGRQLHCLVNRDGYNTVGETIVTGAHYGWSSLDADAAAMPDSKIVGRFAVVPGYGNAYTPVVVAGAEAYTPQTSEHIWFTDTNVTDSWVEWVYVLGQSGIDIYTSGRALIKVGHVRYDANADMFDEIEGFVRASTH